ncbi:MAG: omega amino acid--pyruvate aminotransferase [Gammaproteobacteria bacterium RIFCSPHIGHO2_12_FULL_42_13]|nr:MAG: omega amino acid--pyruvate aminotransferase [Gammaproteobacteria bacterium RIFCSPHIGHO2_12_FULL_42_13]
MTDLEAFWMPFSANRHFKANAQLVTAAKGMHYTLDDGRQLLDGTAGLWCVNAGHAQPKIIEALQQQAAKLDYVSCFQMGHEGAFQLAHSLTKLLPSPLDHVFFTNSGSESVDTALKIALAYHALRGDGTRTRLIGRERAYHGTGFGGISVGGIVKNRIPFGPLLPGVDHLPHTHSLEKAAFSRGQPAWGAELADGLLQLVELHDASTIAAVIVEPMAGATGVLIPPQGYLERLRSICDKYGILLIFDEVITGFGRLGSPFAATLFGVTPDLMTLAKGLTNGAAPAGAVAVSRKIYNTFMEKAPEGGIELFHGYTYSGHPLAMAAGLATLEVYREQDVFGRAKALAPYWEEAAHSLRGLPGIVDIRNLGLVAGIEFDSKMTNIYAHTAKIAENCYVKGVLVRALGANLVLSPPLIAEKTHVDKLFGAIADAIGELA